MTLVVTFLRHRIRRCLFESTIFLSFGSTVIYVFLWVFCCFFASPCSQSCTVFRGTDQQWWKRSTVLKPFPWQRGPGPQDWWRPKRCLPCYCSEPNRGLPRQQVGSSTTNTLATMTFYRCGPWCLLSSMLMQMCCVLECWLTCSLRMKGLRGQEKPEHQHLSKPVKLSGCYVASPPTPNW